jgi:hypothetical protein
MASKDEVLPKVKTWLSLEGMISQIMVWWHLLVGLREYALMLRYFVFLNEFGFY